MRARSWLLAVPVSSVLLTYVGYPAALAVVVGRRRRAMPTAAPSGRAPEQASGSPSTSPSPSAPGSPSGLPSMTVVVAAYDEEAVIEAKIADLRRQDYPGPVRIVVVTDGSTDATPRRALVAGAEVLHQEIAPVHVSGHACSEEMRTLLSLVRPRAIMPIHGEYRMLAAHALLARDAGIPDDRIVIAENG